MTSIIPSPFIVDWVARIVDLGLLGAPRSPGSGIPDRAADVGSQSALDVAMGRGRHAALLARAGFRTYGVDVNVEAVREAMGTVAAERRQLLAWCADLTSHPLPRSRFDLVVVTRYLQRDLFPALRNALTPGGVVLYETFTSRQRALGVGPTSPDHLLDPGELRQYFTGMDELFYEEVSAPEAVARIVARDTRRL